MTKTTTTETTITDAKINLASSNGILFHVRIVDTGDSYGLNDCLVNDGAPMVEVFDTRYNHTPLGQFTGGRWYADTILQRRGHGTGIDLNGSVADWNINSTEWQRILEWVAFSLEVA